MNIERLQEILDAFGADPRRWPEAERAAALSFVAGSDEARRRQEAAHRLDALLDEAAALVELDLDAPKILARVTASQVASQVNTSNIVPLRVRASRFSFGWPSFAGLAAAAAAGFVVGWLNLAGDYALMNGTATVSEPLPGMTLTEVEPW